MLEPGRCVCKEEPKTLKLKVKSADPYAEVCRDFLGEDDNEESDLFEFPVRDEPQSEFCFETGFDEWVLKM